FSLANRISYRAQWTEKPRDVFDRRKTHRRAHHESHSARESFGRSQTKRNRPRRLVARRIFAAPWNKIPAHRCRWFESARRRIGKDRPRGNRDRRAGDRRTEE